MFNVSYVAPNICRVTCEGFAFGSALNRYNIIQELSAGAAAIPENPAMTDLLARLTLTRDEQGVAIISLRADGDEDWIGFADVTRDRMYHRGHRIDCWVSNVKSYIPVPLFMSTRGYGILVNTTHRVRFDMAASNPDQVAWRDPSGHVDFYVFLGGSYLENTRLYTQLTGKPKLPPEWAFGLWYICRETANDYEAVSDALNFRRERIPCDVIGLEPYWMETYYDMSVNRKWNSKLFPIPAWAPNGPCNFIDGIRRMGFHFELWECNEYDLSYEEERRAGAQVQTAAKTGGNFYEGAEVDTHFTQPRMADTITRPEESWFEHHKKFIDQGASFFKQDGSMQVNEHPDRVWGNGMRDAEMHNLYPVIYVRQMYEGFKEYKNLRPVTFTVSGWVGFQAYAGTWSGDTGGRLETLGGMLNNAVTGHNWQTNDMEIIQPEGIHFGYLQPWSQINSWSYFKQPWIQGEEVLAYHRFYSQLRSRLIPYLYSWAYQTSQQGLPLLLRPLQLEFERDAHCRQLMHEYLLGRDLLVIIYKKDCYLPAGRWKNFWTGEVLEGSAKHEIAWPKNRGGNLMIREGAIIPFGPLMQYRKEKPLGDVELYLFPGNNESSFDFFEDDGVSFAYESGTYRTTRMTCSKNAKGITVRLQHAGGCMPAEATRTWSLKVALDRKPTSVSVNQEAITDFTWDAQRAELTVPSRSDAGDMTWIIE